jgi:hypothetical protein
MEDLVAEIVEAVVADVEGEVVVVVNEKAFKTFSKND